MVDSQALTAIRQLLQGKQLRILITGGTGFVGARVAALLAEADQIVTITGRNRYRTRYAWHPRIRFLPCDICDAAQVERGCRDQDVVIHAAALATSWGPAGPFHSVNVTGTENVVRACQWQPTTRLVHVSTTAIHFEFRDKLDVPEDATLPKRFACEYAKSKAAAEAVVQDAVHRGVNAIIVRARAVFGPGDNALLPRLLTAAKKGRLPTIGRGDNRVDLTYVDNLAYALCLAMVRGEPGSVCTITNEDPILLWPVLHKIAETLGYPKPTRNLSYSMALAVSKAASIAHRLLRRTGEPILTSYSVGLLSKSQTFSPNGARRVLGYHPVVSMEQGISQTLQSLVARNDRDAACCVRMKLFTTGYTLQPFGIIERGQRFQKIPVHATCALIEHPQHGMFLFDTGYASRFAEATSRFPYRLYGHLAPAVHAPGLSLFAQLSEQGVAPDSVRGIILSHFHADHIAGLKDFPACDVISSQQAWNDVAGRRGMAALRRGFLPSLLPMDFEKRFRPIEHFHDPGMGPFENCHDLFGDGSVRLIPLPGHARGQIGALIQTGPGKRVFLAADATWTTGSMRSNRMPHWLTYSFIDSIGDLRQSLHRLHLFCQQYPAIEIVPTHCPEVAERYGWNAIVREKGLP